MTRLQLRLAMSEMSAYNDRDAYVSDLILSYAFQPYTTGGDPDLTELEQLRRLWDVIHLPFAELMETLGLRAIEIAQYTAARYTTVMRWQAKERQCSPAVRLLLGILSGYIDAPAE